MSHSTACSWRWSQPSVSQLGMDGGWYPEVLASLSCWFSFPLALHTGPLYLYHLAEQLSLPKGQLARSIGKVDSCAPALASKSPEISVSVHAVVFREHVKLLCSHRISLRPTSSSGKRYQPGLIVLLFSLYLLLFCICYFEDIIATTIQINNSTKAIKATQEELSFCILWSSCSQQYPEFTF